MSGGVGACVGFATTAEGTELGIALFVLLLQLGGTAGAGADAIGLTCVGFATLAVACSAFFGGGRYMPLAAIGRAGC